MSNPQFVTIRNSDLPSNEERFQVATYAYSRQSLDIEQYTRTYTRLVSSWTINKLGETILTHTPSGDKSPAGIYRLDPK